MGPTGKSVARSYAAALDILIPEDAPIDTGNATGARSQAAERYATAMKYLTSTVPNSSRTVVDVYVEKQQAWTDSMKEWDRAKQAAKGELTFSLRMRFKSVLLMEQLEHCEECQGILIALLVNFHNRNPTVPKANIQQMKRRGLHRTT